MGEEMKDKQGNKLTTKEFFQKWKQGIKDITPLQTTRINIFGSLLVFIGIFIGLYATFVTKYWWLFIILCGSLILTSTAFISTLQKYFVYKELDLKMKIQEELNQEEEHEKPED